MPKIECKHNRTTPSWDYVRCNDCGWIITGTGVNRGWFPSMEAAKEFEKYKTYPGYGEVKPLKEDSW